MGRNIGRIDFKIILLLLAIGCFGLGIILTISTSLFFQQLFFLLLGLGLLWLCASIDSQVLYYFSPIFYVFGVIFLSLSYLGPNIRGATRWIIVLGMQLQPSELVKPLMLLALAYFISRFPPRTMKNILINFFVFILPFFLIFKQPDLGTSLVYISMWGGMMIAGGLPIWLFVSGILIFILGLPMAWQVLAPYQKDRIFTFLSPASDPGGAGYNALQSMIAVGSGQFFGKGLGLGTQSHLRFLPEYHTDFIFGSLVEELGFFGGALLLLLYGGVLWNICKPFLQQKINSAFIFVYSIGLLCMMLSQIVINTGMNMGIVPITGITLPLVSYGGSSLLSILTSFGVYMALMRQPQPDRSI